MSCFGNAGKTVARIEPLSIELSSAHSLALAELIPLLMCGEESAALAFGNHANSDTWSPRARQDFHSIEIDETRHAFWLERVRASVPEPCEAPQLRRRVKHFFLNLASPNLGIHLGHVAALDSAVCLILGRLRRTPAFAASTPLAQILARIHADEARHVAIARHYARELCAADDLFECAAHARECLTSILSTRGNALDTLGVSPDRLLRQLRSPPRRLFT